jgi:hypothetical protein
LPLFGDKMINDPPRSPNGLSTTQIQSNLRELLVPATTKPIPPPQYASENLPKATPSEPFTERPSTWGSLACGGMGGLSGAGAGYAMFGFPWGLTGAALCLPAMVCSFRFFKGFDASAEKTKKSNCIGFEPKQYRPG